jgi:hypothetical protein
MGACHPGWALTEPAPILRPLADPLEIYRRPPVAGAYLRGRAGQGIAHVVQARLLGVEGDLLRPVVARDFVPQFWLF